MRFALFFIFTLCLLSSVDGQNLVVNTTVTDATCSANGRVDIAVAGGSGNYRYNLNGACGADFQSLSDPFFETLPPCTYQLIVTDRELNLADTSVVTVGANDEILSVSRVFDRCEVTLIVTGGAGPYNVEYQIGSLPATTVVTADPIPLGEIGDQTVEVSATDQCGNSRRLTINGAITRVRDLNIAQGGDSITLRASGGVGPFAYTITSDRGSFTNESGRFGYDQIGCSSMVTIEGGCPNRPLMQPLLLDSRATIDCINYNDGSVTVSVDPPGVGPYTFTVVAGGVTITSSDPTITGIPPGATDVSVTAVDACGEELRGTLRTTPSRLVTPDVAETCADTTLSLFVGKTCAGDNNYPVEVTCTTCPGAPTLTQTEDGQLLDFADGVNPGNYEFRVEDACGTVLECTDSVLLELIPACDSILVNVIQRFTCNNETSSRLPLLDPSFRYSLFDATGVPLAENSSANVFTGLTAGTYSVSVNGECLAIQEAVTIEVGQPIDPVITVDPIFESGDGGACELVYRTLVSRNQGPYLLTSLSDPALTFQLNDFNQESCNSFTVPLRLPPGEYRLASLSLCGERLFTLPDLQEDRIDSVVVSSTCPGASVARVFARLRSADEWRDYFASLGLRALISSQQGDFLSVNGRRYNGTRIVRLPPGDYTVNVAIGFGGDGCFVDAEDFVIPDYEPVELLVRGDYLCGDTGTAPLELQPTFGNAPYVLRRIDCDNVINTLETFTVAEGESVSINADAIGTYCFVVEDGCGITSDFQVEVRSLEDLLAFAYTCEPSVRLFSDTINGVFTWFNADGTVAAMGNDVLVPPSLDDRVFNLEVETEACILTSSLNVPGRLIAPALAVSSGPEIVQCDAEEITLTATTDPASTIVWSGADAGAELRITGPGTYTVTATNDLGCVTVDSVVVRNVTSPTPVIGSDGRFCPGEPAVFGISSQADEQVFWLPTGETTDTIRILSADRYFVRVTNTDGCVGLDSLDFVPPEPIRILAEVDSISCFGLSDGAITVSASGGTGQLSFNTANADYPVGESTALLPAGTYSVVVADENGCTRDTTVVIDQPDSLSLSLGPDVFAVFGDPVTVPFLNSLDTITAILLQPDLPGSLISEEGVTLRADQSLDLSVTLFDGRGCPVTDAVTIIVDRQLQLYAPTAFSPNGDGVNDRFTLQGTADVANIASLRIFDRWGSEVFARTNLAPNDLSAGWAGLAANNRPLNPATFVWQAEVEFFDGTRRVLSGAVNLVR